MILKAVYINEKNNVVSLTESSVLRIEIEHDTTSLDGLLHVRNIDYIHFNLKPCFVSFNYGEV